jgi:hypothetical protein
LIDEGEKINRLALVVVIEEKDSKAESRNPRGRFGRISLNVGLRAVRARAADISHPVFRAVDKASTIFMPEI